MTPEEFRRYGHEIVDWIADYRARLSERPVMSPVQPGETRALVPARPPEQGEPLDQVLKDLERVVLPGITHWNHPSFFAYFPSNAGLASVLADLVSSGLGAQAMSWQTSPAATELEEAMMDWLRQAVDLPASFTGVIQDTASTATFVALLCARERATGFSQETKGFTAGLTIYASEEAHSSVAKAALLAGFGRDNLRLIPTDDEHAMRPDALEKAIATDKANGRTPCAVVATIGTTATTAFDPIVKPDGLWLHVDAAMAGSAMILPECRPLWRGVEAADSIVFNPHKWLGVAFDCTAYYVKDPQTLVRVMSTNPSYLQTAADEKVRNLRDWGLQLGRRFRALKLWFLFREQGLEKLRQRLRRDLENAQWLAAQVDRTQGWERVAPVKLQTVCIRHKEADNLAIANRVNRSGRAYVTPSVLKGRQMIRVSIGAEATSRAEVAAVWSLLQSEAKSAT